MFSSIVSTIVFITQFNFFLLLAGEIWVEAVSVEALNELEQELSLSSSARLTRVLSIISSGIDSLTLRFCQNIGICEFHYKQKPIFVW